MIDASDPQTISTDFEAEIQAGREWSESIHTGCSIVASAIDALRDLASAFGTTGNRSVANDLFGVAQSLEQAKSLIHKGANRYAAQQMASSTQATTNMMRALFAGIEVGKRPE